MIDLTNKPEGATHYHTSPVGERDCYIKELTPYNYFYWHADLLGWCVGGNRLVIDNCKPIDSWSIYNNTKPLSELSDEQAAELTNYWRRGESMERNDKTIGWRFAVEAMLSRHETYRAKQKSERELFVDEWKLKMKSMAGDGVSVGDMIGQMFDAAKAHKVGE